MNQKRILAIIPARGGSRTVPKKNIKPLVGRPLIAWTIKAALESRYINRLVVSTEDKEIAEISKKYGAEVIKRPKRLARDSSPTQPVLEHAINFFKEKENYNPDLIVLLQATSPLRTAFHIDEAVEKFLGGPYDSLLSVHPSHAFIWRVEKGKAAPVNYDFKKRPRRQDINPEYRENGAIYVLECKDFMKKQTIPHGRIGLYVMPEEDSIDFDSEFDIWLCGEIIKKRKNKYEG